MSDISVILGTYKTPKIVSSVYFPEGPDLFPSLTHRQRSMYHRKERELTSPDYTVPRMPRSWSTSML